MIPLLLLFKHSVHHGYRRRLLQTLTGVLVKATHHFRSCFSVISLLWSTLMTTVLLSPSFLCLCLSFDPPKANSRHVLYRDSTEVPKTSPVLKWCPVWSINEEQNKRVNNKLIINHAEFKSSYESRYRILLLRSCLKLNYYIF